MTSAPTEVDGTWRVTIPRPSDGWLSANERLHWRTKARRVGVLRRSAYVRARVEHVPTLPAARIECWFAWPDARRRDVANLSPTAKAVIDGLVEAGLLPDDDDTHLLGPDLRAGMRLPKGTHPALTVVAIPMTPERIAAARGGAHEAAHTLTQQLQQHASVPTPQVVTP